jgi:hypothetical protein
MFRVAAALNTAKGLYYINWGKDETRQNGATKDSYHPPPKTMVEVVAMVSNKYQFSVDTLVTAIPIGTTSVPIRIHVSNAPATDATVNLSLTSGANTNITINPVTLTFSPDVNERYFEITIDSKYDTTVSTQSIAFSITGTDKDVFSISTPYPFTITTQPANDTDKNAGSITSWGVSTANRTNASITPSVD